MSQLPLHWAVIDIRVPVNTDNYFPKSVNNNYISLNLRNNNYFPNSVK